MKFFILTDVEYAVFLVAAQFNPAGENEANKMCSLKKCDDFVRIFKNNTEEYHTLVFSTEGFDNLTVS